MNREAEDWQETSEMLASALKLLMGKAGYYGHTPCCGEHYRGAVGDEKTVENMKVSHKDSCFAMNALVVYELKNETV